MRQVYLDHQAATPALPEVFEAMRPFFSESYGNPSSLHHHGLKARDAMARAREQVAALIHADSPEEIIFTSDGTESSNMAVKGAAYAGQRQGNHLVVSRIEHPAVINSVEFLGKNGFTSTRVEVDGQGFINPAKIKAALTDQTILIAAHHVNPDIGTIQPVKEIGEVAHEQGLTFYTDAEASAGWLPINVKKMGADLLSFSPHRFHGPKGVGVLYRNRRARLTSLLHGGAQENGWRAGVENVAAIVGAGVAAEMAARTMAQRYAHCLALQTRLWEGLKSRIPYLKLNGPSLGAKRIATNLNISVEFVESEGLVLLSDMNGIALAGGASCVGKSLAIPPVLAAIGLPHSLAQGAIIMSLGDSNTEGDIDYVTDTLAKVIGKLRGMSATWDEFEKGITNSAIEQA